MVDKSALVLLGQCGAPQGIKGEVRVKAFTADPLALGDYGALRTADGRRLKPKRLREAKGVVVVKFEGVNTREEAEALARVELFVERHRLPVIDADDEDEYYVTDLIGCDVVDGDGEPMGTVARVDDFGAGDVLDIRGPRPLLVAFTRANVPEVDLIARRLVVVPPVELEPDTEDEAGEGGAGDEEGA